MVVYTALDANSRTRFSTISPPPRASSALPRFDTESTKTVGLAQAIMAEAARPRCDVFWNNEILNTLRLQQRGLLEPYQSPAGRSDSRRTWRSPDGTWHGFAGRARVLIVNTNLVRRSRPARVDPRPGRRKMEGPDRHRQAAVRHHGDARRLPVRGAGRRRSAPGVLPRAEGQRRPGARRQQAGRPGVVAPGQLAFGLTDTDDAIVEIERGQPVAIVYPDQGEGQLGTLFIPNTLAIVKGCPHPDAARKLVDFLLRPDVESGSPKAPAARSRSIRK